MAIRYASAGPQSMKLLLLQGVPVENVLKELRRRFGTSGIAEKAARTKK